MEIKKTRIELELSEKERMHLSCVYHILTDLFINIKDCDTTLITTDTMNIDLDLLDIVIDVIDCLRTHETVELK